jgi:hypothetical protein
MKITAAVTVSLACLSAVVASAALAPGGFEKAASELTRVTAEEPPAIAPGAERPGLRVLLSSVDMTISLIDAYGQCRDEANTHEQCMSLIRETLDHARSMIGH